MYRRYFSAIASILALSMLLAASQAWAQITGDVDEDQPVALIADDVVYDTELERLTATGNVEVYYGDRTLTADRIVYDNQTRRIEAEGEIVLRDAAGATVFGDIADLDADLRDGIVRGAQSILGDQGKLAAVEAQRFDDRFNVLSKAVYSPCDVCSDEPTPFWRIRARKIIHDEEKRQIHYENAWFDLFGVPIAWTPYFRHPDPTVDRATGFLVPRAVQSSNYGAGLKVPYFVVIDDQSDVTIEPFFTTGEGIVAEMEYRRAFENGRLSVGGSVTRSDFTGERSIEGHLDTSGLFEVGNDISLGWDVNLASDDDYLRFFDFSNDDRLTSEAFAFKYDKNSFFDVRAVRFQSLRNGEPAGQIPVAIPDVDARYELPDFLFGGDLGFTANAQTLQRNNGFDSSRVSLGFDWERETILPMGVAIKGFAEVRGDLFSIRDVPGEDNDLTVRLAPMVGVEARYPLIWDDGESSSHYLEPIMQAILAPYGGNGDGIVNEDSLVTEFDENNLFDLTHFSGLDGFEEGPRLNVGLRYQRLSDDNLNLDATVGRVFRFRDADEFSIGSGLVEAQSDWVAGWSAGFDPYVTVRNRLRFDDSFNINRNEVSGVVVLDWFTMAANYTFLAADPDINQPDDRQEVTLLSRIDLSPNWQIRANTQRDIELGEFVRVGGGVTYSNECCEIDFFVQRRFTDSDNAPGATSFGVQVKLLTLGTSDNGLFGSNNSQSDFGPIDRVVITDTTLEGNER
ncbi:MAG: LPS assembly protein LptD [Pseudomonadota bacterium]